MMHKSVCYLVCLLFVGFFLSGAGQPADAAAKVRYISNRVKIQRPEKAPGLPAGPATAAAVKKQGAMVAVPQPKAEKPSKPESGLAEEEMPIPKEEMESLIGTEGRLYSRKGRVDPFEPFIHKAEPEVSTSVQQMLQIRPPRTPLERMDLSQLKLTAILRAPGKVRALVEEASGKGYVIKEGTFIGNKGGRIAKILKDRVVVKERYLDVFGKIAVRERELKLQKQPGE